MNTDNETRPFRVFRETYTNDPTFYKSFRDEALRILRDDPDLEWTTGSFIDTLTSAKILVCVEHEGDLVNVQGPMMHKLCNDHREARVKFIVKVMPKRGPSRGVDYGALARKRVTWETIDVLNAAAYDIGKKIGFSYIKDLADVHFDDKYDREVRQMMVERDPNVAQFLHRALVAA